MENMTKCGFVRLLRDHTLYEIMSNYDVELRQVVCLFKSLAMEKMTVVLYLLAPDERHKPLPVFSEA